MASKKATQSARKHRQYSYQPQLENTKEINYLDEDDTVVFYIDSYDTITFLHFKLNVKDMLYKKT